MNITSLGEAQFPSLLRHAASAQARIPAEIVQWRNPSPQGSAPLMQQAVPKPLAPSKRKNE